MKLGRWSTTAASNNTAPPDGFPEGQAPSTINNCFREVMASIRTVFNDAQFVDQDLSPTFVSTSSFRVPGDQTNMLRSNVRLKMFDTTTIYGTISSATYANPNTTVTVLNDAGNLSTSLSSFAVGVIDITRSYPGNLSLTAVVATNVPKAWVNFVGFGSGVPVTINASFNVATVSASASSLYKVTFTTPFTDANYAVTGDNLDDNDGTAGGAGAGAIAWICPSNLSSTFAEVEIQEIIVNAGSVLVRQAHPGPQVMLAFYR